MHEDHLDFKDKVRRIRVTGITIEELAQLTGVSSRTVRRWALGEHVPTDKNLAKINALYAERIIFYRQR
jgi:transcriptional regulator with XRE-family HTH domain